MAIGVTDDQEALRDAVRGWAERARVREAARETLDADVEQRPAWWGSLADQGLLGLHVAEEHGGSSAGVVELAVVLEELARVLAGGPYLPTVLASLLLQQAGGTAAKELLPQLVDGSRTAAVALAPDLAATPGPDGVVLTGTVRPVLGAALADVLLVGADGSAWYVVDAADCTITPLAGLDPSRRPAEVVLAGVAVPAQRHLAGLTTTQVREAAAVLVSAEAAGLAGWALDTAASYAGTREQFGRPIGQFQAVKHLCADMLVRAEQGRATAWDAARALDDGGDDERALAVAVAAATCLDAAVANTKDAVQVLGGIGYTWEHDAHVFLKRALALRALLGGVATWRAASAALALSGARRELALDLGPEAQRTRDDVRAFLAGLPEDERGRRTAIADAGYLTPHWPAPWGRSAGAVEQLVVDEEFRAAGVRRPELVIGGWAAPTIVEHGTSEQQERFVRPTLHGDIAWCQLFSEPGAGSDLAGLQTKAERVDGGWRITGQKVWTSLARQADWGILLARTSGSGRGPDRHKGITYFLLDMRSPGVDIRPLRELTGHAMFNEVFLDGVLVPDDCVVGPVDGGWRLARTTLANERVAMSAGSSFGRGVEGVLADVARLGRQDDASLHERVGALVCEAQGQALLGYRTTLRQLSGADPGPASSVRKLVGMKHQQDAAELRLELTGAEGASGDGDARTVAAAFLSTRSLTIAGGSSQVLRNVIGERILGLPKDPEAPAVAGAR